MFERFTSGARRVVVAAQERALARARDQVLAEDLLLALLADRRSASSAILRARGIDADRVEDEVAAFGAGDRDALRGVGIDLTAVRERAEAAFGAGALEAPIPPREGWRRAVRGHTARVPFSDAAKQALTETLRQAEALGSRRLEADHIALGLLAEPQAPAARTLRRLGVDPAEIADELRSSLRSAA